MAKVRYKGHKKQGFPVMFPIGVKNQSGIKKVQIANPYIELSDEDALALVDLDPLNFELVELPKVEAPAPEPQAVETAAPAKKLGGRPRKGS